MTRLSENELEENLIQEPLGELEGSDAENYEFIGLPTIPKTRSETIRAGEEVTKITMKIPSSLEDVMEDYDVDGLGMQQDEELIGEDYDVDGLGMQQDEEPSMEQEDNELGTASEDEEDVEAVSSQTSLSARLGIRGYEVWEDGVGVEPVPEGVTDEERLQAGLPTIAEEEAEIPSISDTPEDRQRLFGTLSLDPIGRNTAREEGVRFSDASIFSGVRANDVPQLSTAKESDNKGMSSVDSAGFLKQPGKKTISRPEASRASATSAEDPETSQPTRNMGSGIGDISTGETELGFVQSSEAMELGTSAMSAEEEEQSREKEGVKEDEIQKEDISKAIMEMESGLGDIPAGEPDQVQPSKAVDSVTSATSIEEEQKLEEEESEEEEQKEADAVEQEDISRPTVEMGPGLGDIPAGEPDLVQPSKAVDSVTSATSAEEEQELEEEKSEGEEEQKEADAVEQEDISRPTVEMGPGLGDIPAGPLRTRAALVGQSEAQLTPEIIRQAKKDLLEAASSGKLQEVLGRPQMLAPMKSEMQSIQGLYKDLCIRQARKDLLEAASSGELQKVAESCRKKLLEVAGRSRLSLGLGEFVEITEAEVKEQAAVRIQANYRGFKDRDDKNKGTKASPTIMANTKLGPGRIAWRKPKQQIEVVPTALGAGRVKWRQLPINIKAEQRPRTSFMQSPNQSPDEVTVEVAGKIGVNYDANGVIILIQDGSAACRLGVQLGWRIVRLNNALYSPQLLQQNAALQQPYKITFLTKAVAANEAREETIQARDVTAPAGSRTSKVAFKSRLPAAGTGNLLKVPVVGSGKTPENDSALTVRKVLQQMMDNGEPKKEEVQDALDALERLLDFSNPNSRQSSLTSSREHRRSRISMIVGMDPSLIDDHTSAWLDTMIGKRSQITFKQAALTCVVCIRLMKCRALRQAVGEALDIYLNQALPDGPLRNEMEKLGSWNDFNIFRVAEAAGSSRKAMVHVAAAVVQSDRLSQLFNIDMDIFRRFLDSVGENYHDNPYHNAMHAADVVQSVHVLLAQNRGTPFSELEQLVGIFSAIIHDVGHQGCTNSFHASQENELFLTYSDLSVNENMHCAVTWRLIGRPGCNWWDCLSNHQRSFVRKAVTRIVLSTDMAKHFSNLSTFQDLTQLRGADVNVWPDSVFALEMVVHACDISNPAKPMSVATEWASRVLEEFFAQGDRERSLGLPISQMCDRYTVSVIGSQIGFVNLVVKPLFVTLNVINRVKQALDNLDRYAAHHKELAKKEAEQREAKEQAAVRIQANYRGFKSRDGRIALSTIREAEGKDDDSSDSRAVSKESAQRES